MSLKVMPLKKYCEESGETENAVQRRIDRGYWLVGKEVLKIDHVKQNWIDIEAVAEWARNGGRHPA